MQIWKVIFIGKFAGGIRRDPAGGITRSAPGGITSGWGSLSDPFDKGTRGGGGAHPGESPRATAIAAPLEFE